MVTAQLSGGLMRTETTEKVELVLGFERGALVQIGREQALWVEETACKKLRR